MRIKLNVTYFGTEDKADSISVASDMLAAFAMNPKADGITLSVNPQPYVPPRGGWQPEEDTDTYHNSKVKSRY
jgi:hypothetical protein